MDCQPRSAPSAAPAAGAKHYSVDVPRLTVSTATHIPAVNQTDARGQTVAGSSPGLYGGTLSNATCDREQIVAFLSSHTGQAAAFVAALNADPTLRWSGSRPLTTADLPAYLRSLTPVLLRVDTLITNHGYNGQGHALPRLTVLQAGTAVLVGAYGIPRVRCYCGNPLRPPTQLSIGKPSHQGTPPWPGYHSGSVVAVQQKTIIKTLVLINVATRQPFTRPARTTGSQDTPYTPTPAPTGTPAPVPSPAALRGGLAYRG